MNIQRQIILLGLLTVFVDYLSAESRPQAKRVTAERGSDLFLSCTFYNDDTDKTIVQWLYQNLSDSHTHARSSKSHWRPLFLNAQSLTPTETRYSIHQKVQQINETTIAYSTILTLNRVNESDEGLYMCKSLSPKTIQMAYQVRVIQSLDIQPKHLIIPSNKTGQYSIRVTCVLIDHQSAGRHHEIHWWHNDKRIGTHSNRYARIVRNLTQHSLVSTLSYTGTPASIAGSYVCETDPLRRSISVNINNRTCSIFDFNRHLLGILLMFYLIRLSENE